VTCGLQAITSIRVGAERGYERASAQTICRTANNVQHMLIERSGHYVPGENPAERAGAIVDFLTESPSANPSTRAA